MPPSKKTIITPGSRALQDRLHELLTRLAGTIDHIKNWPEATDASVHVGSTSRLISLIRDVVTSLERVEKCVQTDPILKQTLQSCLIPMDLLELLEHGLNPDCFSRGLLQEAMGQLAGLKRRKVALEMLGAQTQKGLKERSKSGINNKDDTKIKRERQSNEDNGNNDDNLPAAKKLKTEEIQQQKLEEKP